MWCLLTLWTSLLTIAGNKKERKKLTEVQSLKSEMTVTSIQDTHWPILHTLRLPHSSREPRDVHKIHRIPQPQRPVVMRWLPGRERAITPSGHCSFLFFSQPCRAQLLPFSKLKHPTTPGYSGLTAKNHERGADYARCACSRTALAFGRCRQRDSGAWWINIAQIRRPRCSRPRPYHHRRPN